MADNTNTSNLTNEQIEELKKNKDADELSSNMSAEQVASLYDIANKIKNTGDGDPQGQSLPAFLFRTESALESSSNMFADIGSFLGYVL